MMARAKPLVSILERGDSYGPLVELMGGRIINVDLDGRETLNPWDLPPGETCPSNEKVAFLKNLTRQMLGDSPGSDSSLVDNVLTDAIPKVYKRCAIRYSNPIPTFNDLREELANWRDAEKMQRTIDEAHLAAIKLRSWTGESGIYANLFDRSTTMRLDSDWLFFNVEGLSSDPRLETAMSMLIARAMAERAAGKSAQPSITVLDECWFLLDSPALAPEVVQLFRTARKRNASVWGISQTVEDFVGTEASAARAGTRDSKERNYQDRRPATGRCCASGEPPSPESRGGERNKGIWGAAKRAQRRGAAGAWGKSGNDADHPDRTYTLVLLDLHHLPAGRGVTGHGS